jgi:release factor glutamine methyltransferase
MRLLDQATRNRLDALLERRRAGEPLAYIVGKREFFGRAFRVTPDVLIPRPETELLCELTLARLAVSHPERSARVLDLGTGSGAVAVTVACERPQDDVCATDLSEAALEVARSNARSLGGRIRTLQGSWYGPLRGERFDCIVSNPPYVAPGDPHLGQGDLRFEPSLALRDPVDGLSILRSIVEGAPGHLHAGGWLLLEHGWDQASAVRSLLADAGFGAIASHPDLAGIDRVTVARLGNG